MRVYMDVRVYIDTSYFHEFSRYYMIIIDGHALLMGLDTFVNIKPVNHIKGNIKVGIIK